MTTAFRIVNFNKWTVCVCCLCMPFFVVAVVVQMGAAIWYLWLGSWTLIVFVRRLVNKRRRYSTKENNADKCYNIGFLNRFQSKPEDLKAFYYLQSIVYREYELCDNIGKRKRERERDQFKKRKKKTNNIHSARVATDIVLLRPRLKWISAFTSY